MVKFRQAIRRKSISSKTKTAKFCDSLRRTVSEVCVHTLTVSSHAHSFKCWAALGWQSTHTQTLHVWYIHLHCGGFGGQWGGIYGSLMGHVWDRLGVGRFLPRLFWVFQAAGHLHRQSFPPTRTNIHLGLPHGSASWLAWGWRCGVRPEGEDVLKFLGFHQSILQVLQTADPENAWG